MDFGDRLARARGGDRTALDELFARWRPFLRLQADQCLGAELSARVDPSDVVQEALAQAFASLEQFRGTTEGEWVCWLRQIVAGQAANMQRFHHADKRSPRREQALPAPAVDALGLGPLARACLAEAEAELAAAVEALPPTLRTVVVRRVFHQEPFETLARALGRSPGAVRVLWVRALRRLRELLAT